MKPLPRKKCRMCPTEFDQWDSRQVVCSPVCAMNLIKQKEVHRRIKETAQMKKAFLLKDRSYQLKLAQTAFNAFIRERDKDLPCISCQRHHDGQYHAGDFRSVGGNSSSLRFEEKNCFKQCSACNLHLSGNILEYRIQLKRLHGASLVKWLEGPHKPMKYTLDEIIEIKDTYRRKLKDLKNDR